jgi:hypothetical protein
LIKLRGVLAAFLPTIAVLALAAIVPIGPLKWPLALDLCVVYLAWKFDNHTGSLLVLAIYFNIIIAIIFLLVVALALSGASH